MADYLDMAMTYMDEVLNGKVIACEFVKQACRRQYRDLYERDDDKSFPYIFDEQTCESVCEFISDLPHVKGEWTGTIELQPWQAFNLTTVFGWVHPVTFARRFKYAYIECARKNAKSTLTSGVGLYGLCMDDEPGAEIYSAATTRDQAKIVFEDALEMVKAMPDFQDAFNISTFKRSITRNDIAGWFRALSREQRGNLDGLNVHIALIDELHAHKTRNVFGVLETATGSRRSPLIWMITTAGFNRAGVCYEQRDYVTKVLNGTINNDRYYGIIYTIDAEDEWTDEHVWIKANPNINVSVKIDDLRTVAFKAQNVASAQNDFLTKHLNVWVNVGTAWMSMIKFRKCARDVVIDAFEGQPCHAGIDLASRRDITALSVTFCQNDHYYEFHWYYISEEMLHELDNATYNGWAKEGRLIVTPGNRTDYSYVEREVKELARRFDLQSVAYDEYQGQYLANRLSDEGIPMVLFRQNKRNMSGPMYELEALVHEEKYHYDACPVFEWMMSNVIAKSDDQDNIFPRKELPQNKIDGVVAALMGLGRWLDNDENEPEFVDLGFYQFASKGDE